MVVGSVERSCREESWTRVVDGVVNWSCRVSGRRRFSCFQTSCSESVLWTTSCPLLQAYCGLRTGATFFWISHVFFILNKILAWLSTCSPRQSGVMPAHTPTRAPLPCEWREEVPPSAQHGGPAASDDVYIITNCVWDFHFLCQALQNNCKKEAILYVSGGAQLRISMQISKPPTANCFGASARVANFSKGFPNPRTHHNRSVRGLSIPARK